MKGANSFFSFSNILFQDEFDGMMRLMAGRIEFGTRLNFVHQQRRNIKRETPSGRLDG
jgi:hypothetical protein